MQVFLRERPRQPLPAEEEDKEWDYQQKPRDEEADKFLDDLEDVIDESEKSRKKGRQGGQ